MSTFKRKNPSALQAQLQSLKGGSSFSNDDKGEWKPKLDTNGNSSALIRFLPGKGDDGLPFVKLVNHGFKRGQSWYIENCTSTHGDYDSCPVCQYLKENNSYETNKKEYGELKRKTSYWANILVLKDQSNPDNEGKVFKYRFGQKVMDKINAMVEVDEGIGETPIDVTCPFDGANFALKIKKVGGFSNYDESKFLKQSEIQNIESPKMQAFLEENMVNLNEIAAPDKFKSKEELEKAFKKVVGTAASSRAASQADALDEELSNFENDMNSYKNNKPIDIDSEEDDLDSVMGSGSTSTGSSDELDDLLADLP